MRTSVRVATLLGLGIATLSASGYKIPEQSLNSTALAAAYVANANGADASYYNPANMVWATTGAQIEAAFTYINLSSIKYTDNASSTRNGESKGEKFYVPTLHYMSPAVNDWRFGLSITAPGGLSKRWDAAYAKSTAQEFTLKIIELNPTASYKVNDKFAVGFGLRGVYSSGVIKSNASGGALTRDMTADSIDFGYNLALSYRPIENLNLSTTYRSKVDLTLEGNANLFYVVGPEKYNGNAGVTVPLPATFTLATAYTMNKTTVELVYERTYWSAYKELDFTYPSPLGGVLGVKFDNPKAKNWKDVNAYRIGITHQYNDKLKLMAGFAIDKNPVPDSTLGFELPDSDAKLYSLGLEYKLNNQMKIGLAYLYDKKESRTVLNSTASASNPVPNGTFTNASAQLITMSFKYKF